MEEEGSIKEKLKKIFPNVPVWLKIIIALILAYLIIVFILLITGACPGRIDMMPGVYFGDEPIKDLPLEQILYQIKLCPLSSVVY